jgi:hypothetical protein
MGTMLSKRRLPHEQAKYAGREINRNDWFLMRPVPTKYTRITFARRPICWPCFQVLNA